MLLNYGHLAKIENKQMKLLKPFLPENDYKLPSIQKVKQLKVNNLI